MDNREIKDTGNRRQFESGAVRDMALGKGRCDLLPLAEVAKFIDHEGLVESLPLLAIDRFLTEGLPDYLNQALERFSIDNFAGEGNTESKITAILEVAIHYEMGCLKYGEHNWEKGIPLHSFIDSAIRHYLKFLRGDDDERHDRAFVWNILGALWTIEHRPECIDIDSLKERLENDKN